MSFFKEKQTIGVIGERTYGVLIVNWADTPATKSAAEMMVKM
jgi:hypothetical protein